MACLANAVSQHFTTKLSSIDQPDMITSNYEFLGRSVVGPADILITVLKKGRQFSTVRAQLLQGVKDGQPAIAVEALITQGNLKKEAQNGLLSLDTSWKLPPGSLRREDAKIANDPLAARRPAAHKIEMHIAANADKNHARPEVGPSIREQWITFRQAAGDGRGFNNTSLAYLADAIRPLPEQYGLKGNWYPTVNARVEVKKAEPEGGWKWLFVRAEMKMVRFGRFDYDIIICDEGGDIVALSHHTNLIVGAERNSKVKGSDSKI